MAARHESEIRALPLFRDMPAESFGELVRASYVQTFPPQVDLVTEGDRCDFLHIVTEGSVELFASWNDRETTMATIRPVSSFILAATIRDLPYLMSARTLEKSRIVLLPSSDVRAAFAADPVFALAIVEELSFCYRAAIRNTKDLKLRNSIERLANYLLRQRHDEDSQLSLNMEKRKLASYLGMTPENLSRAFKALQAYGVEVDAMAVRLGDIPALEQLAKPTPLIDDKSR